MKHFITTIIITLITFVSLNFNSAAGPMPKESYEVQDIKLPKGVAPEIGGLAFNSKGELIVVTRRYGVLIGTPNADPTKFKWRVFADVSLHNPMGVLVEKDNQLLIPQMAELTRITDTDNDGLADLYENVSDEWGISGNYHETNAGPIPDGKGNWLVAVGTASHNGPIFNYMRGEYSKYGRRGRNFSATPYKGCVVTIKPDGTLEPFAYGFRANNGIFRDKQDRIWVTDNQGDWRGTSPLYHVEKDKFYGHPASLVWDKNWTKSEDPLKYAVEHLEEMDKFRTRAAVELPQGLICSSPAEPVIDYTNGNFGPFQNQMYIGDIAGRRIVRVMLEEVDGTMQGAATFLVDGNGLRGGNNRFCFSPDGKALYVGQTFRGWGGPAEGLQRIVYNGTPPFEIQNMSLTKDGFKLTFTAPVDKAIALKPDTWQFKHYFYAYTHAYGGPQRDTQKPPVQVIKISEDGKTVELHLGEMVNHRIYQLDIKGLKDTKARAVVNPIACYTINKLRK